MIVRHGIAMMSVKEFNALGEYSCSIPSGTTPGVVWKRNIHAYSAHGCVICRNDRRMCPQHAEDVWYLGEYYELTPQEGRRPDLIGIRWFTIAVYDRPFFLQLYAAVLGPTSVIIERKPVVWSRTRA